MRNGLARGAIFLLARCNSFVLLLSRVTCGPGRAPSSSPPAGPLGSSGCENLALDGASGGHFGAFARSLARSSCTENSEGRRTRLGARTNTESSPTSEPARRLLEAASWTPFGEQKEGARSAPEVPESSPCRRPAADFCPQVETGNGKMQISPVGSSREKEPASKRASERAIERLAGRATKKPAPAPSTGEWVQKVGRPAPAISRSGPAEGSPAASVLTCKCCCVCVRLARRLLTACCRIATRYYRRDACELSGRTGKLALF